MKGKPNSEKSDKLKIKSKFGTRTKKSATLTNQNLSNSNYDSKKKQTKNLQSSIKRSKVQTKFNSTKKQSENVNSPSEKLMDSEFQSEVSLNQFLVKKKENKFKASKISNKKHDQLYEKNSNSIQKFLKNKNIEKKKLLTKDNSFSNTDDLKNFKDKFKNKYKFQNERRGVSASTDGVILKLSKFKLNSIKRKKKHDSSNTSSNKMKNIWSNEKKSNLQNETNPINNSYFEESKTGSDIFSKIIKRQTKKRASMNQREIIPELKYLKNNNLQKSSKVNFFKKQKIKKMLNESKRSSQNNFKYQLKFVERSKSIDPVNLMNSEFEQNQNFSETDMNQINLANSELLKKENSLSKNEKRVNSVRQKRKNRQKNNKTDSENLTFQNPSNPSNFLKVK